MYDISLRQKLNISKITMDVCKTLGISFFIWLTVKGIYPQAGVPESAREYLLVLTVLFLSISIIISLTVSDLEE